MIEIHNIYAVFFSQNMTMEKEAEKGELRRLAGDIQNFLLQKGYMCEIQIK